MTEKTIDVDAVIAATLKRERINSIDIMDAVFMRGDKVLEVTQEVRDNWKSIGLHVTDFTYAYFTEFRAAFRHLRMLNQ